MFPFYFLYLVWITFKMYVFLCHRVQLALWVALMVHLGRMEDLLMDLLVLRDHLLPWALTTLGLMARAHLDHSKDLLQCLLCDSVFACLLGASSVGYEVYFIFYSQWTPSTVPASRLG